MLFLKKDDISINLAKGILLEGSNDVVVRKLIKPLDIVFHHYYYRLRYFDLFSQKYCSLNINCDDFKLKDTDVFAEKYLYYIDGKIRQTYECSINIGGFYKIKYRDRFGGKTIRIISLRNILFEVKYSKEYFNHAYGLDFNKVNKRRGSLFMKNFKRKQIVSESYFVNLIQYIHRNPVRHGFVQSVKD